jgi:uncharacterized membrane protein HdeD (DUF308 family)
MKPETLINDLRMFWWAYAVKGSLALVFAAVLFFVSSFLGIFFFDPVTLVYLSLLLGSFVLGNGLLQGVAAGFAFERHLHLRWLSLCESCFELLLGIFIGVSMLLTKESLAFLAGLHALGNAVFQIALAVKMREDRSHLCLLGLIGIVSLGIGIVFFTHYHQPARVTTQALSGFEFLCGITWIALAFRLHRSASDQN